MRRLPTEIEKEVVRRVAERLAPEVRRQLLDDLSQSEVEEETPDGSRRVFHISGYSRPSGGQHSFGVEGQLIDKDGTQLSFDLYADLNGRLFEFELVRWGEGSLIDPDWSALKLH